MFGALLLILKADGRRTQSIIKVNSVESVSHTVTSFI